MAAAPKLDVRSEFEAELKRRGFTFARTDDGRYEVTSAALKASEFNLTVSIENLTRDVERDGDRAAITRFVDRFEQVSDAPIAWETARPLLRFSVEPNDYEADAKRSALHRPASAMTMLVLTRVSANGDVQWLTASDLETWGVSREEAERVASANLDALLAGRSPDVQDVGGKQMGMIPIPQRESKASVIFAPHFRQYIEPKMGWPVFAVTPCRDFVYVFSSDSFELVGKAGGTVLREFQTSGYPVTTEVWKISDAGVEAIGNLAAAAK